MKKFKQIINEYTINEMNITKFHLMATDLL